jgi:ABC-type transport system substrate-binding protein
MKLSACLQVVVSSIALILSAAAATRPQYGGTLRVIAQDAITSLDPAVDLPSSAIWRRNLTVLLFDTLVTVDQHGRIQPALATAWQTDSGNQRWQFRLRQNIQFQDGSALTPNAVAASVRVANPAWKVYPSSDAVVIELSSPSPDLPAELSQSRYAIAKRNSVGNPVGTGPFQISSWVPGKRLVVNANQAYWSGRPFLDSLEITLGVSSHDQLIQLELGKADVTELLPEQARRAAMEGFRTDTSLPEELLAVVFAREAQSPDESSSRGALSQSLDRTSMRDVFLQGFGEPAQSLLPNWLTGYAFLFDRKFDLTATRVQRSSPAASPGWTLGYDAFDPTASVLAERIVLNAHDAGISLRASPAADADPRLERIAILSPDARLVLTNLAQKVGVRPPTPVMSVEDMYQLELAILATHQVIPVVFASPCYALGTAVQGWKPTQLGTWRPAELWMSKKTP